MTEEQARELMELIAGFEHCQKGLCMTPATRFAAYYNMEENKKVAELPSCDKHGGETLAALLHADLLRAGSDLLRDAGFPGWWEAYSGALNEGTVRLDYKLVMTALRAASGSSLSPADTWDLYAQLLMDKAQRSQEMAQISARTLGDMTRVSEPLARVAEAAREVAARLRAGMEKKCSSSGS